LSSELVPAGLSALTAVPHGENSNAWAEGAKAATATSATTTLLNDNMPAPLSPKTIAAIATTTTAPIAASPQSKPAFVWTSTTRTGTVRVMRPGLRGRVKECLQPVATARI
jgi:hypothetical protein